MRKEICFIMDSVNLSEEELNEKYKNDPDVGHLLDPITVDKDVFEGKRDADDDVVDIDDLFPDDLDDDDLFGGDDELKDLLSDDLDDDDLDDDVVDIEDLFDDDDLDEDDLFEDEDEVVDIEDLFKEDLDNDDLDHGDKYLDEKSNWETEVRRSSLLGLGASEKEDGSVSDFDYRKALDLSDNDLAECIRSKEEERDQIAKRVRELEEECKGYEWHGLKPREIFEKLFKEDGEIIS